nr:hypothetical protein CFP56_31811 [Quercus suber]
MTIPRINEGGVQSATSARANLEQSSLRPGDPLVVHLIKRCCRSVGPAQAVDGETTTVGIGENRIWWLKRSTTQVSLANLQWYPRSDPVRRPKPTADFVELPFSVTIRVLWKISLYSQARVMSARGGERAKGRKSVIRRKRLKMVDGSSSGRAGGQEEQSLEKVSPPCTSQARKRSLLQAPSS